MPITGQVYNYTSQFKCLGAVCPDTCCQGWSMQVNEGQLKKHPALTEFVTEESGCKVMKRDNVTEICTSFEAGMCGLQNRYGHDILGDACYFYPRITRKAGGNVLQGASLSCPETARLALYGVDPFALIPAEFIRQPEEVREVLPVGVTYEDYSEIQAELLKAVEESASAEVAMEKLIGCIYSLQIFPPEKWAGGISLFLKMAESKLPPAQSDDKDLYYLLVTTYGLIHATHKPVRSRLKDILQRIEQRLGIQVNSQTLEVMQNRGEEQFPTQLLQAWNNGPGLDAVLKRWIATQIIMHSHPFSGFGGDIRQRTLSMVIRFALTKLALMSASDIDGSPPDDPEVITIIQAISRLMDHLGGFELSMKLYEDIGWMREPRMRSLVTGR